MKLSKFYRYALLALMHPCYAEGIRLLAQQHFPVGLRQHGADRILLRAVQMEYGVTP